MLDGIRLPQKRRRLGSKHYRCLLCNLVISQRSHHLETAHDVDRFFLRTLEGGDNDSENYFNKYYVETTDKLSCIGKNYNPASKKKCTCWCTKRGKYLKPAGMRNKRKYNKSKHYPFVDRSPQ